MRIHCPARRLLNQHADVVCSRAQLNREKGVQRVEDPLVGSRGRAPWVPQSTRGRCMQMRSTQSRERESRGSKTLWRGQGAEPLGFLNQHADVVCSRAQLNREKGVQRVEDPLAGSRGRAPWVPQSTRGRCMQSRSTQSRKGSPEGRRPFGRCRAEPCRSPEAEPLAPPSERNCYEETEAVVCGAGLGALRVERGEELVRIGT